MSPWARRARARGDAGAAIVEAAIIVPLLLLLSFGVIEFGMAWRQANVVERTVQTAGRTVSNAANSRYADYETLRTIDAQISGLSSTTLDRVVVYRATAASGAVPAACMAVGTSTSGAGISGQCNIYGAGQVSNSSLAGFGSTAAGSCAGGAWDRFWCPTTRNREHTPDPDRVGVYLRLTYQPFTGLFPGELTIERRAVYQVEPCSAGEITC